MVRQRDERLAAAAGVAVGQCLGVRTGEKVLRVTDPACREVAEALWHAACEAGSEPVVMLMRPRRIHGEEPPDHVAAAMAASSVCVAPTTWSLTHTVARRKASERGARIATMPGITTEMMGRSLAANYDRIASLSENVALRLDRGRELKVTSPAGTDLRMSISGRNAARDTGIYRNPGEFGNLPGGEAFIAPVEGSASGRLVLDGSVGGIGVLDQPVVIDVVDGRAVSITGGHAAARLEEMVDLAGPDARTVAEFGIGTNPAARVVGNILEDEKVLGTVHVALGANASFGGRVQVGCHVDGVLFSPSVWVDGDPIVLAGRLLVE